MYCPICNSEYREGFTRCTDCGVDLFDLPSDGSAVPTFVVLWSGEEVVLHDTLVEELERADIRFADVPFDVYMRGAVDPLNVRLRPQFGFVVSVASTDLAAARDILDKLLDREPEDASLPDTQKEFSGVGSPGPPEMPLHWDAQNATLEVWSGDDSKRIRFLEASLRANGIPSRIAEDDPAKPRLLICPEDAARAREIVNQIEEAAVAENSPLPSSEYYWHDEPVRSYLFGWLPALVYFALFAYVSHFDRYPGAGFNSASILVPILGIATFVSEIGSLWMIYQSIRYEIRPWRFVLLSFLPLSFVWYHSERYDRRHGVQRLPVAVRLRMSPPPIG